MSNIVKVLYGSHLFGCAVPSSDHDYKLVHLESLKDLLFKDTHAVNTKTGEGNEKVESEDYSLRFYLQMLAKGQVIAMDMFFAPDSHLTFGNKEVWEGIKALKPYIITQNLGPFSGYSKAQAQRYGSKGKKLLTVQHAIHLLSSMKPKTPLEQEDCFNFLVRELSGLEGVSTGIERVNKGVDIFGEIRHLKICGKSFGATTAFDLWIGPLKELEATYGERARLATTGLDYKALYHCVRICREAVELLNTGELIFPRPEAALLLQVRTGALPDDQIREIVDENLLLLDDAMKTSSLPKKPDWDKINEFIFDVQQSFVCGF